MHLIFVYGPVASGKLTVSRLLAERTGMALFHNHLIVDAVAAVFPFGSAEFVRLREQFWLETILTAVSASRSLVFTFAPEPSVSADFPRRVAEAVSEAGGQVTFIALDLDRHEQERRLTDSSREAFGKLRSVDILRKLQSAMGACMDAMPTPALRINTAIVQPSDAADAIISEIARTH